MMMPLNKSLLLVVLLLVGISSPVQAKRQSRQERHRRQEEPDRKNPDDYYKLLGLPKSASHKAIKSRYRKLALQYHPDKVPADKRDHAEDIMADINQAYNILGDEEKREVYDKYGKNGLDAFEKGQDPRASGFGGGGGGGGAGGGAGGFDFGGFDFGGGGQGFGAGGFPGGFPGGGGGGGGRSRSRTPGGGRGGPGGGDPFAGMFDGMFGGGSAGGAGGSGQQQQPQELFPKGKSKVAKLGPPKFPDKKSKNMWLILFYASNDPRAHEAAKNLEKLAKKSATLAYKVGAVDCHRGQDDMDFCQKKQVDIQQDLPTFAFVIDGKLHFYGGDDENIDEDDADAFKENDFDDKDVEDLTAKDLNNFCLKHMPKELIHNINNVPQLEDRLLKQPNKKKKVALMLLSEKYETSSMLYGIAYQFRTSVSFGESRAKNLKLAQQFKVKKYPQLIAFVPSDVEADEEFNDEYGIIKYTGEPKKEEILKWLDGVVKKANRGSSSGNTRKSGNARNKSEESSSSERRESSSERRRRQGDYGL